MTGQKKQLVTPEWIARTFGSVGAWRKSRTGFRYVRLGRRRKAAIHIRLVGAVATPWRLPCPDKAIPAAVRESVGRAVLGFGPRPRVAYRAGGDLRIAVGRRGEAVDRLRADLVRTYGLVWTAEVAPEDDALAEYVATGGNYREHARRLRMRDAEFLAKAAKATEVERSVLLSDRQFERVWQVQPVYVMPEGDGPLSLGDPGAWASDPEAVVVADPGGRPEAPPPLPMAVPKADGRGMDCMFFGFALDVGGGRRFSPEEFEPPLRIALGGAINRALGFGRSERVDERLPYAGDGIRWGRFWSLAPRFVGPDFGPACRVLVHPEPEGRWYAWLGSTFKVPAASKWSAWTRRASVYERERKKNADREASTLAADPPCAGDVARAA